MPEHAIRTRRRRRAILFWIGLLAIALVLDALVAREALPYRDFVKQSLLFHGLKQIGAAWVSLLIAIALCVFHARRWRAALLVVISGLIAGLLELILKWSVGRTRPVAGGVPDIDPFRLNPFRGGFYGFLQQTNLSFPSGHTILAFSTAACLAYLCPRGRCVWFFAASLVAFERVAEAAHYPSDVVGAAMLGIFSSHTAQRLMRIDSFAQSISTSIPYANPDPTPETDRPSPGADDGRSISNN